MSTFQRTAVQSDLSSVLLALAVALPLLLAQPANAQQPEPAATEGLLMLEEIVVTAQKRAQSIQEVPVAISAFDGRIMEDNGAVNLEDLSGIAPNVQISQMAIIPNVGSFTVRGINFTDPDPNADPKTGLSLDGVFLTRNNGVLLDTFDLERVEVLRGPQGTLYGRNNLAGTINLISARPTAEAGGKVKATFGKYGQQIFRAVLNSGGLGEDGRLRTKLALSTRSYDGYSENAFTGAKLGAQDTDGGRATIAYEGDRFDLRLIGDYVKEDYTGPASSNVWNDPDGVGADGDEHKVNQDLDGFSDFETWGMTLEGNRELSVGTLTLVAGYRELEYETFGDFDGWAGRAGRPQGFPLPPFSAFHIRRVADHDQRSLELRFADSHSDLFDYVLGFFYLKEEFEQANYQNLGFPPLPIFFPLEDPSKAPPLLSIGQESQSVAFFGQTDINVTDQLALVLGGRFTLDEKEVGITRPDGFMEADDVDWDEFTWKAGLNYFVQDDFMLYANAATGYKGGGYNSRATTAANVGPYQPETLISYEVGMKGDFVDGRLRLNAAAFIGDYEDVQSAERRPGNRPGQTDVITDNLGDVEISGVELESTFLLSERLTVQANLAYLDAKWKNYFTSGRDYSYLDLKGVARWSGYLGVDYNVPLGANRLKFHVDARYSDEFNVNGTTNAVNPMTRSHRDHFIADEVVLLNANLTYEGQGGRYRISLYGKNLTDKLNPLSGVHLVAPVVFWGPPRQLGVEVELNF